MSTPTKAADNAKITFPRTLALEVARIVLQTLTPCAERIIVAGSLRRRKAQVGDVEILYIPKVGMATDGELFETPKNLADLAIEEMIHCFLLQKRQNVNGSEMFGAQNKFLRHTLSRVPVDLFAATPENWWNYLVCRTGGTDTNTLIASRAKERGYQWNPYGEGFTRLSDGTVIPMESEHGVFKFVGLRYEEPWDRR